MDPVSDPKLFRSFRSAFTLIELLVVIAIIAILAVVVVLTLNPAQLLAQSRDANRVSDLATLKSAVNLYTTDQAGSSGFSLGNASSVYVSVPSTSPTCNTLGLPALPSGYTYACSSSSDYRGTNGAGWIPLDFQKISSGAPFGSLPVDPTNQTSSGLYYTYSTNGSQFMVTGIPESKKQKAALGSNPMIPNYPNVIADGSNVSISPLWNPQGLVAYWPFDKGSGTTAIDASGNGNTGTWVGTPPSSAGTYYTTGKVGPSAGDFGGSNFVSVSSTYKMPTGNFSITAWIYRNSSGWQDIMGTNMFRLDTEYSSNPEVAFNMKNGWGNVYGGNISNGVYHFVVATVSPTTMSLYVDGQFAASSTYTGTADITGISLGTDNRSGIGGYDILNGSLDDVRIYNRTLSPAEVQALYNAEK